MNILDFALYIRELTPKLQWIKTDPGMGVISLLKASANRHKEKCKHYILEQLLNCEIEDALEQIKQSTEKQLVILNFGQHGLNTSYEADEDQKRFDKLLNWIFDLNENIRIALVFNYEWNRSARIKYDPAYIDRFCIFEIESDFQS